MFQIILRYTRNTDSLAEIMKTYSGGFYDSIDKAKEALNIIYKNMSDKNSTKQLMWGRNRKSFIAVIGVNTASGEGYQIAEYKIEAL